MANLILLNGGSSAGKTSTTRALQESFDDLYMRLGIDGFWSAIPPRQLDITRVDPYYYTVKTYVKNDLEYFHITPGPKLDACMYASYQAIKSYLDYGVHVISGQLFWKPEWFRAALEAWHEHTVFFVAMRVSDEEGARREKARGGKLAADTESGGRPAGWHRCSAEITHQGMRYDFEIDNTALSIEDTAKKIKKAFEATPAPQAFNTLYKDFLPKSC